jgi:enoyl-CoA hydratase/carnithine racemase
MQRELHTLWRALRRHDPVRCVVLTGAGEKAFCTGIDRMEQMGGGADDTTDPDVVGSGATPFMFNDPGDNIGPKSCDLWKPVIAAVNGMACGGAFYMLGETEFIIAAEHATFFDPHVTYGMTAAFEPIHMAGIMPFPEIMRLSLMGNYERMSAARAHEIGMVSEVVPGGDLAARANEIATIIASQPRLAIEGTVRAIWSTRSLPQREAVRLGYAYVAMGTSQESIAEGQKLFESGKRVEWKLR